MLGTASKPNDKDFSTELHDASELMSVGRYADAIAVLRRPYSESPSSYKISNLLGLAQLKLGQLDGALQTYTQLVHAYPTDPNLRVKLGIVQMKLSELDRARHEFQIAVDLDPANKGAHNFLGHILAQQNEFRAAREHFLLAGQVELAERMGNALRQSVLTPAPEATSETAPNLAAEPQYEEFDSLPPVAKTSPKPRISVRPMERDEPDTLDIPHPKRGGPRDPSEALTPSPQTTNKLAPVPARSSARRPLTGIPPAKSIPSALPSPRPSKVSEFRSMPSQRLNDLGVSGWTQDGSGGIFQISPEGLAVSISGEMFIRLHALVAMVGRFQVTPAQRRRQGRHASDTFGLGEDQLQRVIGTGSIFLETMGANFHAIDIEHSGIGGSDESGLYLREEVVFAFEDQVSYENGRLSIDPSPAVDLVHLSGKGNVLLRLGGPLKAIPLPAGEPMMVPLARLVGWHGQISPRLVTLGKAISLELVGDGTVLVGIQGALSI